jgi:methionyl-tRNA formyltransferase
VTIMQMDAGLDTGDMLVTERIDIAPHDTTGSLHDKLALLGGRLIVEALEIAACGGFRPVRQPEEGVTYAHKIDKAEAAVDWSLPAEAIARRIRAFDPFPGAISVLQGETIKLWAGQALPAAASDSAAPGRIESVGPDGVDVRCGKGLLRLTQLQRAGGKRLPVADFLHGFELKPGMLFEPRPV